MYLKREEKEIQPIWGINLTFFHKLYGAIGLPDVLALG